MLEQTSKEFRESFLLKLTKEILKNTQSYKSFWLKNEVKEVLKGVSERKIVEMPSTAELQEEQAEELKREWVKGIVAEKLKAETRKISEIKKRDLSTELRIISNPVFRSEMRKPFIRKIPPALRIPEPELPETVRYLRPQATGEQIDLGKLNILLKDSLVKVIECNGPDENVIVIGIMGRKKTPILLNKEEIEQVLQVFSETAKIPLSEGLFKAAVGTTVISAVVSDIAGIKFVIRKISQGF